MEKLTKEVPNTIKLGFLDSQIK